MRRFRGLAASAAFAASFAAGTGAATAQGQVMLGANGLDGTRASLLEIDPTNGTVISTQGKMHYAVTGLAEDPTSGVFYGVTDRFDPNNPGFLITVNKATGAGTVVGDLVPPASTTTFVQDITFAADGTLYGWQDGIDDLVTINKTTGQTTPVGNSGISTGRVGLDFAPNGTLYLVTNDNDPLRTVNPATGTTTAGPVLNGVQGLQFTSLAFDAGGSAFASRLLTTGLFPADIVRIDLTNGQLTGLGGAIGQLDALDFLNRAARTISLKAKPKKVKKGKKTTLSGTVSAPSDPANCAASQVVEIQRYDGIAFVVLKTVTTDGAGAFTTRQRIKKKETFRAVVDEPAICEDAVSPVKTVKLKKEKK